MYNIRMENVIEPMKDKDIHFEKYMKAVKSYNYNENFNPTMLDYTIDNKTTLRLEHIQQLENEQTRIEEMAKLLKENINYNFPSEFFEWLSRDMLGLKYKKWEIDDMKRQYRIKKKRELKKEKDKNKKKLGKQKKKNEKMKITTNNENPFVLKF
jgi:hypothetical protein